MAPVPVPESVLKKRKTQEKIAADKAAAAAEAKTARKAARVAAYKSAEKYVKEYRAIAKQRVRMHRQAKAAGNHFVDAESKLIFVVRIRGLACACTVRPRLLATTSSTLSPSSSSSSVSVVSRAHAPSGQGCWQPLRRR